MCFCKYKERKRDKKVYIQNNLSEIHAHNRKVYIPNTGTYIPAIWDINFAQYPEKQKETPKPETCTGKSALPST